MREKENKEEKKVKKIELKLIKKSNTRKSFFFFINLLGLHLDPRKYGGKKKNVKENIFLMIDFTMGNMKENKI